MHEVGRPTLPRCKGLSTAAATWACLREAVRFGGSSVAHASGGGDIQLQAALDYASELQRKEKFQLQQACQARSCPQLRRAYVDIYTGSHCGVMLFGEGNLRRCAEVLQFNEVVDEVIRWKRAVSSLTAVASQPPQGCQSNEGQELCLDMQDTLSTLSLGWLLAMEADLIRVSAWHPWPWSLLSNYDLLIFRVDELRFLQPAPAWRPGQLRLVVGSEPHLYGDDCDQRYRHFNDLTANSTERRLHALGICPILLDPFLVATPPGSSRSGPPGLPHWWQLPLDVYNAAFPIDVSSKLLPSGGLEGPSRVLIVATPSGHATLARKFGRCAEHSPADGFMEELKNALAADDKWELIPNWQNTWSTWHFWQQLRQVKYVVLLPFSRQSLGRTIAEAAAVAAVPVLGWRNKWFMKLLMPPLLSVRSITELAEKLLHLERYPEEYRAIQHSIVDRLRFVNHARASQPASSAEELAVHVGELGKRHQLCQLQHWSSQDAHDEGPGTERSEDVASKAMFHDPLSGAVNFARVLLCEPSKKNFFTESAPLLPGQDRHCDSDRRSNPGWEVRALDLMMIHRAEDLLHDVAWRLTHAAHDGAVWSAVGCGLLQLAQRSGEDAALALVLFRLGERALQHAHQRRTTWDPRTQIGAAVEELFLQASRWHLLRNYTAQEWSNHLQSIGTWNFEVDAWVRYQVAGFWQHV